MTDVENSNNGYMPTPLLRFEVRSAPAPEFGSGVTREVKILQQRWDPPPGLRGHPVWRDVPAVSQDW